MSISTSKTQFRRLQGLTDLDRSVETDAIHIHSTVSVRYKYALSFKKKGVASLILRVHTTLPDNFSLPIHHHNRLAFFSARCSIPTTYWSSRPRVLGWHHTNASNLKVLFFVCAMTGSIRSVQSCGEVLSAQIGAFVESLSLLYSIFSSHPTRTFL